MKIKILMLLLLVTGLSVRCSDFKDKKREPVQLREGETFDVELEGLPQPNQFIARIHFKGDLSRGYEIRRISSRQQVSSFFLKELSTEGLRDEDVKPGESYAYSIGIKEDGEFEPAATVHINVTPDVIVDGKMGEGSDKPLEIKNQFRLFFKKDSSLRSLGRDVDIEVQEIFSEGGKLQTFSPEDFAPIGENGLPSGNFHLRVKRISGPFVLEVRGQPGGKGQKGVTGVQGNPGPDSSRSVDEGFELQPIPWVCRREWYRADVCKNASYEDCRSRLHPGAGGKGGVGLPGYPGNIGLIGGDASDTYLEIPKEAEEFKVIFEGGIGGLGGDGGNGGPGGPGGRGGPRTNVSPGLPCDPPPSGPRGDAGPLGPLGPKGPNGNKGKLFINGVVQ